MKIIIVVILSLVVSTVSATNRNVIRHATNHIEETDDCTVCLEPLNEELASRYWYCNHGKFIHKQCASKILISSVPTCPICRKEPKITIHRRVLSHHRSLQQKRNQFIRAFLSCDGKTIHRLLQQGINCSSSDTKGTTILHEIARSKNGVHVQFALDLGGKESVNTQNNLGNTPLHAGVFNKESKVVKILLESGATPTICTPNDNGVHPLHGAAFQGRADVIEILLAHGAHPSLHCQDKQNKLPIDYAYLSGNQESIELLEQAMQTQT